jgi:hypothetical protein
VASSAFDPWRVYQAGGAIGAQCPKCFKRSAWIGADNVPYKPGEERPPYADELQARGIEVMKPSAHFTCRNCYESWPAPADSITVLDGSMDPVPPFILDTISVEVRQSDAVLAELEAVRANLASATRRQRRRLLAYDDQRMAPVEMRLVLRLNRFAAGGIERYSVSGRPLWEEARYCSEWSGPAWVSAEDYRGMVWSRPWRVASKYAIKQLRPALRQLRANGVVARKVSQRELHAIVQPDEEIEERSNWSGEVAASSRKRLGMPESSKIRKPIWQHQFVCSWPVRGVEALGYGLAGVYFGWMALVLAVMWIAGIAFGGYIVYLLVKALVEAF